MIKYNPGGGTKNFTLDKFTYTTSVAGATCDFYYKIRFPIADIANTCGMFNGRTPDWVMMCTTGTFGSYPVKIYAVKLSDYVTEIPGAPEMDVTVIIGSACDVSTSITAPTIDDVTVKLDGKNNLVEYLGW